MNKKGFTLIELLAVIVILAIIALITTPIVLNLINQSKEAANKRSVEAYAKAVEYAVAQYEYEHNGELPTFDDIKNNIEYSNSDVKCHVAINCDTKGSVELTGCQVGSYTNNYYKYSSLKGNKGATVDDDTTAPTGNSSVEAACGGGSGSQEDEGNYMYYTVGSFTNPVLNLEIATDSYGYNECPDGYGYEGGTCYYMCESGSIYDGDYNKCKSFDYYTTRPTDYNAYLKYALDNDELVTPPEACIYSDTYGGELCLTYGDYTNNISKMKTYFKWDEEGNESEYGDGVSCSFSGGQPGCSFDFASVFVFSYGGFDASSYVDVNATGNTSIFHCGVHDPYDFYCYWE